MERWKLKREEKENENKGNIKKIERKTNSSVDLQVVQFKEVNKESNRERQREWLRQVGRERDG